MKRDIVRSIGYFYFDREGRDEEKAITAIEAIKLYNIDYQDGVVILTVGRPGILIGKKGENINKLRGHLKSEFKYIKEITVEEDVIMTHLYDFDIRVIGE